MPDNDDWTVAMVLKWVLTRDLRTVLAMAESYGAIAFSSDGRSWSVVPEDVDAVMTRHGIDSIPEASEERVRQLVLRGEKLIAKMDEIYRALRRGNLEARARRNGTGDVETIVPNEWLGLKFLSWNGHDLAVPVTIDQGVLDLPQPTEDYLHGRVSVDVRPAVWPDPLFDADRTMQIWRADAPEGATESAEFPAQTRKPTVNPSIETAKEPPKRPDGISDREWQTYLSALEKGYDLDIRGSISKAARAIARDRGKGAEYQSERRAIHRVREKINEQRSIKEE
jgi:hypothetical protein